MWYEVESTTEPTVIDLTSSQKWAYVRKNIHTEERTDEITGIKQIFYLWKECKIPKEVWTIYEHEMNNESRISDVEEVLTEIIGG